ncbi:MAG TPA: DUF1592 domain-containing protein [Verrucomicrobia bacterium]|nr:DUF1592 domain-containing protein [Verrucomicrobiales bacterium]HIL54751.1 DUF1592 domain-containing protein [Verrucomicrobiota bacterium]
MGVRYFFSMIVMVVSQSVLAAGVTDSVESYCINCHNADKAKGKLDLESILNDKISTHAATWETVVRRLSAREMPPPKYKKLPDEATVKQMVSALVAKLDAAAKENPQPGRVATFRRLTRTEYQNAIRDLLGVQIDAAVLLPKDEESHGFDNITVSTLSPALVERYVSTAQKISRLAVGAPLKRPDGATFRVPADFTQEKHVPELPIGTRGGVLLPYTFPRDGEYELEVRLARDRNEHVEGLRGTHKMEILIDRGLARTFTIRPAKDGGHDDVDKHLRVRVFVKAGPRQVGVTFPARSSALLENKRKPYEASFNVFRHPRRSPAVYQVSITGPFSAKGAGSTPSRQKVFIVQPDKGQNTEAAARQILSGLVKRAYRRPVQEVDLTQPLAFFHASAKESGFEAGIQAALESILVNPAFLFRVEKNPAKINGASYPVSDLDLTSRLSFFLWSSLPDEELIDLAAANKLSKPETLEKQVRRMLIDKRASSLVTNFAAQWLYLRNLDSVTPDLRLFPDFDDNLRRAFRRETELFVESILREDRSVLDLLKADYTFLNERLAKHYRIPNVFGSRFRRVALAQVHQRGGLLRQGSILTVTSYATRTSPVIRGNWILENLIGMPPKPPPPDVPALDKNKVNAELSIRERLVAHRTNPACASCHERMDPIGFALENFDAVGRWREFEDGRVIDVAGGLPDGSTFDGVAKLEDGLLDRPELFVRTLTEKLLIYALGRGMESYDAPAVRKIVAEAKLENYRISSIILGVTKSVPFRMRAGAQ